MRAVAITPKQAHSARIIELPRPAAPRDGVLVRVLEIGVCGTDAELEGGHIGIAPPGDDFLVVGHESIGVVEEAGPEVKSLARGDLVVAMVRRPDDCPNCRAGSSDMCVKGEYTERGIFSAHGFLAEYYADRETFLVKLPPELRGVGVLLEPLSVAVKAVHQAWEIQRRLLWEPRRALVLGAGSLGLLAAFLLRLHGREVDVFSREGRLSARAALLELTGARYFPAGETKFSALGPYDFIFEATGATRLMVGGVDLLRNNGVMAILGIASDLKPMPVPVGEINNRVVQKNQVLFGSVNANRRDFDQGVLDLAAIEQRWPGLLAALLSRREPLDQFRRALDRGEEDIKVVVEVS